MKRICTAALFAAATVVAAGTAFAQNNGLRAEIPFSFSAASTLLPPGTYLITESRSVGGTLIHSITNEETRRKILVVANSSIQTPGTVKPAQVVFNCGGSSCALAELWLGSEPSGYQFKQSPTPRDRERQVAVLLTSGTAK